jgi:hypothetical protein
LKTAIVQVYMKLPFIVEILDKKALSLPSQLVALDKSTRCQSCNLISIQMVLLPLLNLICRLDKVAVQS